MAFAVSEWACDSDEVGAQVERAQRAVGAALSIARLAPTLCTRPTTSLKSNRRFPREAALRTTSAAAVVTSAAVATTQPGRAPCVRHRVNDSRSALAVPAADPDYAILRARGYWLM